MNCSSHCRAGKHTANAFDSPTFPQIHLEHIHIITLYIGTFKLGIGPCPWRRRCFWSLCFVVVPALTGFLSCPFLQPQECILFYHPVCEHLHTVIVLLSSRLGECLQDTVLTPHPLSGDVSACCFSPALCYPTSTLIGTLSHPTAPLKLVILNFCFIFLKEFVNT